MNVVVVRAPRRNSGVGRFVRRASSVVAVLLAIACTGTSASAQRVRTTSGPATRAATTDASRDREAETQVERTIPMYVGESRLIDAPWPVKRVSVNNPAIADVDVISPQQVQLQGIAAGITDLTLWSEDERIWRARVEVELDLRKLQNQLAKVFPRSNLQVSQIGEVIIIGGQLGRAEQAMHLRSFLALSKMNALDMTSVSGLHQVQLHVRVAEVSRNALQALNINTFYDHGRFFAGNQLGSSAGPFTPMNVGVPEGTVMGPQRIPFSVAEGGIGVPPTATLFAGFPGSDLELFIQALAENQYLRLLAEPTLVAASGENATFLVGGEVPIPISDLGEGTTTVSIEYREYGVRLSFAPLVLGDGTIRLNVIPEISELTDVGAITILGSRIPALLTRRVTSTFELQSGQTFAIAGLINRSVDAQTSRVPGLGDLPILGALFRSVRYQTEETEMVVLVTASLVEPQSVPIGDVPYPGMSNQKPGPWRLYIQGRIDGKTPNTMTPAQQERFRELGLENLNGPGAWASYEPADTEMNSAKK